MPASYAAALSIAALLISAAVPGEQSISAPQEASFADALVPATTATAAPEFVAVDRWGDRIRLSDYQGKIVVLHFFATWCASCRDDLRTFQRIHERFATRDVVILGLAYASGDREQVGAFVDELGVTFPTLMCREDTRAAYDVPSYPTNVIVDKQGRIRYAVQRKMNESFWEAVLDELAGEDPA